ncbi:basic salivary proline-rich protein 4-like [Zingiber officinale]|uniref:basic salivary proline-rich protein 4-like n=1 Tax=Zingiber officinale TaxID=94328 RepID=UPI001C4C990D|nr:basic salivary proline-rich protein 4-like [Zingiber officinale]
MALSVALLLLMLLNLSTSTAGVASSDQAREEQHDAALGHYPSYSSRAYGRPPPKHSWSPAPAPAPGRPAQPPSHDMAPSPQHGERPALPPFGGHPPPFPTGYY